MRAILLAVVLTGFHSVNAQYYYKDIIGTKQSSDMIRTYQKNRVTHVVLSSFDDRGQKDEDFFVEQEYSAANGSLKTTSRSEMANESILVSFIDNAGNVVRTIDSSDIVVTRTDYSYSPEGRLLSVVSFSIDSSRTSAQEEKHLWKWNTEGKPEQMLRIKNGRDTSVVTFKLDDQGQVSEEREVKKGQESEPVYYYYNAAHQLTDIVRYSKRARRLLPEYMFEYTGAGQLSQQITVPANSSNYLIWRYLYNDQGLKTKEVIYNKMKKLAGRIEYQYTF